MEPQGTVTIIGVGLIGGSIGLALRARGGANHVIGVGRNPQSLEEARRLGAIDEGTTNLVAGVARAEVAVVCTPVTHISADAIAAARSGPAGLLVTDAGSTKRRIVETIETDPRGRAAFVGAHPIAGSERKGAAHAQADLFEGRACVLTPTASTPPDRLRRARSFWTSLGCRLVEMGPARHDETLARTSHLPHVVAAALAAAVPADLLPLAAGAYRDGTRVAGSDADLWTAIFLENRMPVIEALGDFQNQVALLKTALIHNDADAIRAWWQAARERRLRFDEASTT